MIPSCIEGGLGAPHCPAQCGACRELDETIVEADAARWRHHPGAGAAHILRRPDDREALCGAHQPGQWPDQWARGDGGLRRCEICKAAA